MHVKKETSINCNYLINFTNFHFANSVLIKISGNFFTSKALLNQELLTILY